MQGSLESNFPSTMLVPRAMRKSGPSQARTSNPQPVGGAGSSKEVLSAFSSSWLLALLASLDLLLDADDISTLRTLGKTCLRVIRELPSAKGTSPESAKEQQARAWMVVAVISEVWGQRDLWGF